MGIIAAFDAIAHGARRNSIVYVVVRAVIAPRFEVVEVRRGKTIKRVKDVLVAVDALVLVPDERLVIDAFWCFYRVGHELSQ